MRRRLLILVGGALAWAVIFPAALELLDYHQKLAQNRLIDREHCDRIRPGMSRARVEAILGGPPGDFHTVQLTSYPYTSPDGAVVDNWYGDAGYIAVAFDEQGRVQGRDFSPAAHRNPPPLTELLRAWLRRVWP